MGVASQGAMAKLYVEPAAAPHTFDTNSERWEFYAENIQKRGTIVNPPTIRGTRSPCSARSRSGPYTVGGQIHFPVSPVWLDSWLPRILGAAEVSDVFDVAETIPAFGILLSRIAETFQYTSCYVNRAVFRPQPMGEMKTIITATLDIIGTAEITGTSAPNVTLDCSSAAYQPYLFSDTTITLLGTARQALDFVLVIDNHLDARFTNSLTATSITPTNRTVVLRTTNPFTSDELDLYDQDVDGDDGQMVWTNENMSATWDFPNLQVPPESPTVTGKQEIPLYLTHTARRTTSDTEVTVTNDSTP